MDANIRAPVDSAYCVRCEPGSFTASINSPACFYCPPGNYQPNGTAMGCAPCAPGTAAVEYGSLACTACPFDTYAPEHGMRSCKQCPYLRTTSQEGSVECDMQLFEPVYAPPPPVYVENWVDKLPVPLWVIGVVTAAVLVGSAAVSQARRAFQLVKLRLRARKLRTMRAQQRGNKYELGQLTQEALLQLKRYRQYRTTPPLVRMWDVRAYVGATNGDVRNRKLEEGEHVEAV